MSGFESVAEQIEAKYGDGSEATSSQDSGAQAPDLQTKSDLTSSEPASQQEAKEIAQAIAELDKMEKFKFKGEEYTPEALEKAILRMKDYTNKTQSLSKDRETLEQESKFYGTLYSDLRTVQKNPHLAQEFIRLYPEKFHGYLKDALSTSDEPGTSETRQETKPQVDVELISRLQNIEKRFYESDVEKHKAQIEGYFTKFSKMYPDSVPDMVMARAVEAYNQKQKLTEETWEGFFKASDQQIKDLLKAKYGDMVKKQTEANTKAKDVASGGGTVTSAPKKFKSLKEVSEYAEQQLTQR